MAWIELHQSVMSHRKTMLAAEALDLPEVYMVGHLVALWTWALDNAPSGVLPPSARVIARAAQWPGDPQQFVDALCSAGFLDGCGTCELSIHRWSDYAGRLIEKREANKERMRKVRATHVQRTDDARSGATVPNPTLTVPINQEGTKERESAKKENLKHTSAANAAVVREENLTGFVSEVLTHYPRDKDNRLPSPAVARKALKRIAARDWDDFLVAVEHYAGTDAVRRGFVMGIGRFSNDEWRRFVEATPPREVENDDRHNGKRETVAQHNLRVVQQLEREWAAFGAGEVADNESPYPGGEDGAGRGGIRLIGPGV